MGDRTRRPGTRPDAVTESLRYGVDHTVAEYGRRRWIRSGLLRRHGQRSLPPRALRRSGTPQRWAPVTCSMTLSPTKVAWCRSCWHVSRFSRAQPGRGKSLPCRVWGRGRVRESAAAMTSLLRRCPRRRSTSINYRKRWLLHVTTVGNCASPCRAQGGPEQLNTQIIDRTDGSLQRVCPIS